MKTLIVDDDQIVILIQRKILETIGLNSTVLDFGDGHKALEFLRSDADAESEYLIFLDINMPVLDGWGFLNEIQNEPFSSRLKIIVVSSSIDPADRKKSRKFKQVIGYLEKPLEKSNCEKLLASTKVNV
jgi:CheY-like chemotaxis protein